MIGSAKVSSIGTTPALTVSPLDGELDSIESCAEAGEDIKKAPEKEIKSTASERNSFILKAYRKAKS
jgi:hypothetical protein